MECQGVAEVGRLCWIVAGHISWTRWDVCLQEWYHVADSSRCCAQEVQDSLWVGYIALTPRELTKLLLLTRKMCPIGWESSICGIATVKLEQTNHGPGQLRCKNSCGGRRS